MYIYKYIKCWGEGDTLNPRRHLPWADGMGMGMGMNVKQVLCEL